MDYFDAVAPTGKGWTSVNSPLSITENSTSRRHPRRIKRTAGTGNNSGTIWFYTNWIDVPRLRSIFVYGDNVSAANNEIDATIIIDADSRYVRYEFVMITRTRRRVSN